MSKSFRDAKSRWWELALDLGARNRVLGATDVDLFDPQQFPANAPDRQAEVLYHWVRPQADQRGIDEQQFADGLDALTLLKAEGLVYGEFNEFMPEPDPREKKSTDRVQLVRSLWTWARKLLPRCGTGPGFVGCHRMTTAFVI